MGIIQGGQGDNQDAFALWWRMFLGQTVQPPLVLLSGRNSLVYWPLATVKRDTGQLSLLRAADFLLVSSWFWDGPWSWPLSYRLSFVRLCVFQALQLSRTLRSSQLICIQSNPKSELWVRESRPTVWRFLSLSSRDSCPVYCSNDALRWGWVCGGGGHHYNSFCFSPHPRGWLFTL